MTNTAAVIATITELCALPELTRVADADGRTLTKQSSGQPTTNPNWIFWEADGLFLHSDEVTLPATVKYLAPMHEHVWEISTTSAPRCGCGVLAPKPPKRKSA